MHRHYRHRRQTSSLSSLLLHDRRYYLLQLLLLFYALKYDRPCAISPGILQCAQFTRGSGRNAYRRAPPTVWRANDYKARRGCVRVYNNNHTARPTSPLNRRQHVYLSIKKEKKTAGSIS